jgi:8-oxo-dGTP pyrophosphatase MutT (NUDIX family)
MENKTPLFLQFFVSEDGKNGEWWFPKGVVENEDASLEDRAKQEALEEVGLEVKIVKGIGDNTYSFYWDRDNIKFTKTVHYFLAESISTHVELAKYSKEKFEKETFREFRWSTVDVAINMTKHLREKELLKEAAEILSKE